MGGLHVPSEAVPVRRSRFADWRFLTALAALVLAALLALSVWRNFELQHQVRGRDSQIVTLGRQIAALEHQAHADRRASARERGRLLRQQALMIRLLRRHGIAPPFGASRASAAGQSTPGGRSSQPQGAPQHHASAHQSGGTRPSTSPSSSPKPSPKPKPKPKPSPSPTPGPLLPGLPLPDLPIIG